MLGAFRLALAVALSHANVRIGGLNPGVIAVVCFYLISGYVMTGLLRSHYASLKRVPHFYLDRALRIFPQYLAIAAVTLAWFLVSGRNTAFLQHAPRWPDLLNNLAVAPLNYYMFNGSDHFTLVPPAWSLGAELQFYLLMPLLLLWRLRGGAFLLALAVFFAAAWGALNTDAFGYRLLPGVLVFFLLGSALYDARDRQAHSSRWIVLAGVLCAAAGALRPPRSALQPRNAARHRHRPAAACARQPAGRPVVWRVPEPLPAAMNAWRTDRLGAYLLASLALSALTQVFIERPALRWRHRLRAKKDGSMHLKQA